MAAGVEAVDHAPSIALAWESEALAEADVVVLDSDLGGAMAFVQEIAVQTGARVLLCMHDASTADVLEAIGSGVGGALARDQLTPDTPWPRSTPSRPGSSSLILRRASAQRAVTPVGDAIASVARWRIRAPGADGAQPGGGGLSNREIAQRLSYSERTIKTILHDIVIRLGVKSRSQAVALAVRERII